MTERTQVFLSYSHNDVAAATNLRGQLERGGVAVFGDQERSREGELWLNRLQEAVAVCSGFVVLVGRDGVRHWVGADTQVALDRYFGPYDDTRRLPIFPILLGETGPKTLPAILRPFQSTAWNGADALPERLLDQIRERAIVPNDAIAFQGCPFVGLDAYRPDQAHLFFGRQKETLDALACFDTRPGSPTVRWLEISGSSGSGKTSLMSAGLLPLVDQGWLWPRTGFEHWRQIGPMMPGERPVTVLAEHLARAFALEVADVRSRLEADDAWSLAEWLRDRKPDGESVFLLAIDQFEELFTLADPAERGRFDRLLADALEDAGCPLFVISTVRADFLDRFEELPRLVAARNRSARAWTLPLMSAAGLREVIDGPARLAGLDASEVKEAMVAEARDEPGALPLVENALQWLWEQRTPDGRLSGRLLANQGGLAGLLSRSADDLLRGLGKQRDHALELLFQLVKIDPEGRRHTRQRIPLAKAVAVAGGGADGWALIGQLAGMRTPHGPKKKVPLLLITIIGDTEGGTSADGNRWVNLIHETLICSKGPDANGQPQPYWPTLWRHIDRHKDRAARRERLQLRARQWQERKGLGRLFGLAGWSSLFGSRGLAASGSMEARYLRWSRARALAGAVAVAAIVGLLGQGLSRKTVDDLLPEAVWTRWLPKSGEQLPLPELVEIPGGTFTMGSQADSGEQPVHPVTFTRPFYLGTTEVTFAQYDAFARATGRAPPDDSGWSRDHRPVINVDWSEARAYAHWLGEMTGTTCRLPSEAEWEYACRAGTTTAYALPAPDGSDDIGGKEFANCSDCGSAWDDAQTAPVASFPANAWGLQDMHGNVWEWVEDCWHGDYGEAPEDGRAWLDENGGNCDARVLRGGSWRYDRAAARCSERDESGPEDRYAGVGFRVLCSSPLDDR